MLTGRYFKTTAILTASLGGTIYPNPGLNAAAKSVKIEVTGAITPSCKSSMTTATFSASDITKAGSSGQSFTVDCNAPFQYSMQSQNGALQLINATGATVSNQIETPYDVHIRIPLTLGGQIDDTCSSAAIKQGSVNCKFSIQARRLRSIRRPKFRFPGRTRRAFWRLGNIATG